MKTIAGLEDLGDNDNRNYNGKRRIPLKRVSPFGFSAILKIPISFSFRVSPAHGAQFTVPVRDPLCYLLARAPR